MPFPWHNPRWREAGEFLEPRVRADERVLAPDAFWPVVSRLRRYAPENLDPGCEYDWVVLDTGDVPQIPRVFLEHVLETMAPVFTNPRFVIFSTSGDDQAHAVGSEHLADLERRVAELGAEPSEPNRYVEDRALADSPCLVRFSDLSDTELRAAMDDVHHRTGYLYPTVRDQAYRDDMVGHVAAFVERCPGRLLDLATGGLAFVDTPEGTWVARTELSEVGTRRAREADRGRSALSYAVMDAQRTAAADASFDGVLFVDAIEHVRDPAAVIAEAARVLVDRGQLLVTFANRNSVHLVLTRKLGAPEFMTNHQHIREFTFAEVCELLAAADLDVEETAGVSFYPYWGVPRVDQVVRRITDEDPEFVEMMREIGRRVGPEYAYTGIVRARRRSRAGG